MVNNSSLIEISGSVATGKTSLAKAFADKARLVLEDVTVNQFLASQAQDEKMKAFCSQMSFMTAKAFQRSNAVSGNQDIVVSDYSFYDEPGYQRYWVGKYADVTSPLLTNWMFLAKRIPKPDCIVQLTSSIKEQRRRVKERGRSFEQKLWTPKRIAALNETLAESFNEYVSPTIPVLNIRSADINLDSQNDIDMIWNYVQDRIKKPLFRTPVLRND